MISKKDLKQLLQCLTNRSELIIFLFLTSLLSFSQNTNTEELIDNYNQFTEVPREIAYVHLNKSTYVKGEMMGFTAYVFDKYEKKSSAAVNLYCTISNEAGDVLKKKLTLVENGIASNIFNIDDSLSAGVYTFKAYTNWMKNFDENNHYQQSFKVIDSDNNELIEPTKFSTLEVDLQVLGEGGHLLYGVTNTVGIIAKNNFGLGISKATGQILDTNGAIVSEFQLNDAGMAKTVFIPEKGKRYIAAIFLDENTIRTPISDIKDFGIVLSLNRVRENIVIELLTNDSSFPLIKEKPFKVALHNGSDINLTEFNLKDQNAILKFPKDQWFTGVNIITIFDENNNPILERLFFNKDGIQKFKSNLKSRRLVADSLNLVLTSKDLNLEVIHNMSISVLPSNTKSYKHQHNILSQTYLRPYVNGTIENANSYFQTNTKETDYNLDLVMLTQGWSSYDWSKIFNYNQVTIHPYERGIDVIANVNGNQKGTYIAYPLERSATQIFKVSANESQFTIKGLTPTKDDLLRIGYIDETEKDFTKKPSLYLQFYPSEFSSFDKNYLNIIESFTVDDTQLSLPKLEESWNIETVEVLDEVVITALKEKTRAESLQTTIMSKVKIVTDREKLSSMRLDLYLQRLGWITRFDYFTGKLTIKNPRVSTADREETNDGSQRGGSIAPLVYLDDALLNGDGRQNFDILSFITMEYVDYIEHDKTGLNGGLRGLAGFIKIYTDPNNKFKEKIDKTAIYDVPLRYNEDKKFYIPKYQYYNSRFFNEYGTIAWFPKVSFNDKGELDLKIFNTNSNEINLYIEGVSANGSFISEVKRISTN